MANFRLMSFRHLLSATTAKNFLPRSSSEYSYILISTSVNCLLKSRTTYPFLVPPRRLEVSIPQWERWGHRCLHPSLKHSSPLLRRWIFKNRWGWGGGGTARGILMQASYEKKNTYNIYVCIPAKCCYIYVCILTALWIPDNWGRLPPWLWL